MLSKQPSLVRHLLILTAGRAFSTGTQTRMPQIEEEIKLDFNDVLFKPKRSNLKSRSEVSLEREFQFLHSRKKWSGTPIISSNMDTTGTFEMGVALAKYKCLTTIHKYYSLDDWRIFGLRKP